MKKYISVLIIGVLLVPFVSKAMLATVAPTLGETPEQIKERVDFINSMNELLIKSHTTPDPTIPPTKETLPVLVPTTEQTIPFTPPQPEVPYNPDTYIPPSTTNLPQGVEPDTIQQIPAEIPAIAHVPVFNTYLAYGVKGEDKIQQIKALQSLLVYMEYYQKLDPQGHGVVPDWHPQEEIDGIFGRKTEKALKSFQEFHNLVPDGKFGPLTRAVAETVLENIQNGVLHP